MLADGACALTSLSLRLEVTKATCGWWFVCTLGIRWGSKPYHCAGRMLIVIMHSRDQPQHRSKSFRTESASIGICNVRELWEQPRSCSDQLRF